MQVRTFWRIIAILFILMLSIYIVSSVDALFIAVDQTPWTNGQLIPVMEHWQYVYLNPLHALHSLIHPANNTERTVARNTLIAAPILTFLFFFITNFKTIFMRSSYKEAHEYGSHGTARWATVKEIFRNGEITGNPYNELDASGVVLGYLKASKKKAPYAAIPPDSEINQNVLVLGGSGIGKDYTYIKTQIFHTMVPFSPPDKRKQAANERNIPTEYSLVVIDPKGEAYRDTAGTLEMQGYEVYTFNLVNMSRSFRWNAIEYVTDDLEAEKLANMIINDNEHKGADPFWPQAERALLCAIILFVRFELPETQQHLPNVLYFGLTFNEEEQMDAIFNTLPYSHPALFKYKIFKQAKAETRAGILIGFGTQLSLFANSKIGELTSQSDFRLDEFGLRKTALFLIIPDGDDTFKRLTSLFFAQLFQQSWDVANKHGGTLPIGIRVLANEMRNIGKIPMLAERTSVMRSKGISIQIVLQSRPQLYTIYDKEADEIIGNCDTIVFLGTNDPKTAEQMEKDLGETTIEVQSRSQAQNGALFGGDKVNVSTQHQARKLRTANEIRKNSRRKNIIIQNGSNPFETYKTPFTHHPLAKGYKERLRDPNKVIPPKHRGMDFFTEEFMYEFFGLTTLEAPVSEPQNPKKEENTFPDHIFEPFETPTDSPTPSPTTKASSPLNLGEKESAAGEEATEKTLLDENQDYVSSDEAAHPSSPFDQENENIIYDEEGGLIVDKNTGEILEEIEVPEKVPTNYKELEEYDEENSLNQKDSHQEQSTEDEQAMLKYFTELFKNGNE